MKRLIAFSLAALIPMIANASGPYTVPNFSGTEAEKNLTPVPTFEAFYKGEVQIRVPASLPADVAAALEEELQPTQFERSPAAVKAKKPATRFPSNATEGFEYKVKIGKRLTAFWVVKRGENYELIFANNAGSKASFAIPVEHFTQLNMVARGVRAPASNIKSCKNGYVRMQFYDGQQKPVNTCLNLKKVEDIQKLGAILSTYVR
jgi:hypothetical protein